MCRFGHLQPRILVALLWAFVTITGAGAAVAQTQDTTGGESDGSSLPISQKDVAERFGRLEQLLLQSSELEALDNPTRAALLRQAAQLSKQTQLYQQLAEAAKNLESEQYSEALALQKTSRQNLQKLLELLQKENREKRVREQRDQVRQWIEETDRLLRMQGSLRGRTEGGQDSEQAADDQGNLANRAEDIAKQLKTDDPDSDDTDSDDSDSDDNASDGEPKNDQETGQESTEKNKAPGSEQQEGSNSKEGGKPTKEGQEGQESQGESKPDGQDANSQDKNSQKGSQSGDSQSEQSKQPSSNDEQQPGGQPSGKPPKQPQSPTERARQKIEAAQQKMKEAQEALKDAQRDGAIEKQREAEDELREAIEQLEEILRQLREEEIERSLASLESRLRRMLDLQNKVLEETERLFDISGDGPPSRQVEIRASNLSLEQRKVLSEGERAYLLLREEGSSAAFPEAIEQINADATDVIGRLSKGQVDELTIMVEGEIVNSLEEMIAALVAVQKENREKQKQQRSSGAPQQGQPGEEPLVGKLAEIRLIRTLQNRINKRTELLSKILDDPADVIGQVGEADILEQLNDLAQRQASLEKVTRDMVTDR